MKASDLRPIQARSGATLQASALGLGAAALGGMYEPVTEAAALEVLEAAWGLGLRFVDTAPFYGYTRSERRVGSFLAGKPRAQFTLSTKAGRLMRPDASVAPGDDGWADPLPFRPHYDYSEEGILRSFEDSLQRLGLARIDVLLVHDIGQLTHGDAHARHWQALCDGGGWRALEGLRRRGLVGAIGLGVNEAEVARAALDAADIDCVLLAGRYTLLEQGALPLLDECARRQVSVLVGGPYNSGLLAGQARYDYAAAPPQALARAEALRAACARHGVPLQAAALQFPLAHPAVAAVLSGMRTADEVRANVAWFETPIPAALWADLRGAGLVAAGAPVPEPVPAMKVDAHQHFWRLADRAGGWPPPQLEAIHRDFGPTDLAPLLQATGVEATVLVQSLPTVADTHWMLSVARATPWVRGVVGWVDFKSADAPAQVAALAHEPLLKGLRPMLQDLPDDHWIADEATAPAAAAMARHGLAFDALVLPRQLPALWVFARRHPGLAIIIDHGAKPPIAAGGIEPWRSDMARLAALPNVCCKLSGLLTEAGARADAAGLLPWVQALWQMFGPGRLLWGSDWPVLRLAAGYEAWHAMADGLVSSLDPGASTAERAALFGDNATRLYRL